jgi:CDP-6-deoxy-D-xylo-4-hexulose-3-dehydrase
MKYPLATESWGPEEKEIAKSIIDSGKCTMGSYTKQFEKEFAQKMGSKYAIFVNSGSSANLLAVAAFFFRKNGLSLKVGDEVIVPAVSWSTTYYPLQQYGLKLKFVDVNIHDFNISVDEIKKAITPNTKAIMAVNILGMPCDFDAIKSLCTENKLILIEDNCESLGATYTTLINGKYLNKQCGTFGDVGTTSSFFSHHISTIEGGFCLTDDEELAHIIISLRAHGWLRNLPDKNQYD